MVVAGMVTRCADFLNRLNENPKGFARTSVQSYVEKAVQQCKPYIHSTEVNTVALGTKGMLRGFIRMNTV